jgi:hypothetical protein
MAEQRAYLSNGAMRSIRASDTIEMFESDLPLNFHPGAVRVCVVDTPPPSTANHVIADVAGQQLRADLRHALASPMPRSLVLVDC